MQKQLFSNLKLKLFANKSLSLFAVARLFNSLLPWIHSLSGIWFALPGHMHILAGPMIWFLTVWCCDVDPSRSIWSVVALRPPAVPRWNIAGGWKGQKENQEKNRELLAFRLSGAEQNSTLWSWRRRARGKGSDEEDAAESITWLLGNFDSFWAIAARQFLRKPDPFYLSVGIAFILYQLKVTEKKTNSLWWSAWNTVHRAINEQMD